MPLTIQALSALRGGQQGNRHSNRTAPNFAQFANNKAGAAPPPPVSGEAAAPQIEGKYATAGGGQQAEGDTIPLSIPGSTNTGRAGLVSGQNAAGLMQNAQVAGAVRTPQLTVQQAQQGAAGAGIGRTAPTHDQLAKMFPPVTAPLGAGNGGNVPGGAGAAGAGETGAQANPDAINSIYQPMIDAMNASWGNQETNLKNQMGAFQRQADIINARTGRSIAGGYASLAGGALGRGMDAYRNASADFNKGMAGLQLNKGKDILADQRRAEDIGRDEQHRTQERGWAQEDKADAERQHYQDLYVQLNGELPSEEALDDFIAGKSGAGTTSQMSDDAHIRSEASSYYAGGQGDDFAKKIGYGNWNALTPEIRQEALAYASAVFNQYGRWPSAGELRDRMKDVGLYKD
jgi:hypothetical protein